MRVPSLTDVGDTEGSYLWGCEQHHRALFKHGPGHGHSGLFLLIFQILEMKPNHWIVKDHTSNSIFWKVIHSSIIMFKRPVTPFRKELRMFPELSVLWWKQSPKVSLSEVSDLPSTCLCYVCLLPHPLKQKLQEAEVLAYILLYPQRPVHKLW